MDQISSNQQSIEPQEVMLNQNNGKRGVFKIILIIILLIVVLGILNYFNIIPLSKFFPNYLGFLPHKDAPNGTPQSLKIENNSTKQGFPTPIPSLTENAKKTLIDYLPTTLGSSLLATSSSDITFIKEKKIEGYTAYWNTKENSLVKVVFTPSSLIFAFNKTHSNPPSKEVAQDLAPKAFLITPKGEWLCKNIPDSLRLYCENFWEEDGIKRGVALLGYHPDSTSKESTIYFCEYRRESKDYEGMKSCISP